MSAAKTCTPVRSGVRMLSVVSAVPVHVAISYLPTANTAKVTASSCEKMNDF